MEVRDLYYCPNCRAFVGGRGKERTSSWEFKAQEDFYSLATSADGSIIVAGCHDNHAYCFDFSGHLLWKFKTEGVVRSVDVSANGEMIVIGAREPEVYVLDRAGNLKWQASIDGEVNLVTISRRGDIVSAISERGTLFLFDHKGEMNLQEHLPMSPRIYKLLLNKEHPAAITRLDGIHVKDPGKDEATVIEPGIGPSHGLGMSANESLVAWGTEDEQLKVVDAAQGLIANNNYLSWRKKYNEEIRDIQITRDGSIIAVASGWTVSLLDRKGNPLMCLMTGGDIHEIKWSGDGNILAAGSYDDEVYVIDRIYHFVWSFPTDGPVDRLAISEDGNIVVVAHYYGKDIQVFNPRKLLEALQASNRRLYQAYQLQQVGNNDAAEEIYKELGFEDLKITDQRQEEIIANSPGALEESLNTPLDAIICCVTPKTSHLCNS